MPVLYFYIIAQNKIFFLYIFPYQKIINTSSSPNYHGSSMSITMLWKGKRRIQIPRNKRKQSQRNQANREENDVRLIPMYFHVSHSTTQPSSFPFNFPTLLFITIETSWRKLSIVRLSLNTLWIKLIGGNKWSLAISHLRNSSFSILIISLIR